MKWFWILLLLVAGPVDLFAARSKSAPKKRPSCETVQYQHHDLPLVAACIEKTAKQCESTSIEAVCRRALELKDILLSLLNQPEHLAGKFWRKEAECKAFTHLQPVFEKAVFLKDVQAQGWNLQMTRICGAKTPLAQTLSRFCTNAATPEEVNELKGRYPSIENAAAKEVFCYKPVGVMESRYIATYCAAGFNKTCWYILLSTLDTSEPSSVYEPIIKQICQSTRGGGCNEAEVLKEFKGHYELQKKMRAELVEATRTFLAEVPSTKGNPLALDFEKDPKAYASLLETLIKMNKVLYPNARRDRGQATNQDLLKLPLMHRRVRVPLVSCGSEATTEVPSKPGLKVRIVSYECSPHNRFRLALTGEPDFLKKFLKDLPDPGPNEHWVEGTIVGFQTTGVVTQIIVAVR